MKKISLVILLIINLYLLFSSSLFAQSQNEHIPPCHAIDGDNHTGSICWGYATARAFGREWNDSPCGASDLYLEEINTTFFEYHSSWPSDNNVPLKSIVRFAGHAAYVIDKVYNDTTEVYDVTVAHVPYEGADYEEELDLFDITGQGSPVGYYTRKYNWSIEVFNDFSAGEVGIKIGPGEIEKKASGYTSGISWGTSLQIEAVMDDEEYNGVTKVFDDWYHGAHKNNLGFMSSTKYKNFSFTEYPFEWFYRANYTDFYKWTFRNQFIGVSGYPGTIKVNTTTRNSPHEELVEKNDPVTVEAINQTYNYIKYTFDEWSDSEDSKIYIFTPESSGTLTAEFIGKPRSPYYDNLQIVGDPEDPVGLIWNQHPNEYVTKYEIWRKVKHNGEMGSPEKIATNNSRSDTTYTDYDYALTDGYTDDLLYYDVRAYYSTESTYSDPEWIDTFGEMLEKRGLHFTQGVIPEEFSISNYPNPFNPSTTVSFSLVRESRVSLVVYNIVGQQIKELFTGYLQPGVYQSIWDGTNTNGLSVSAGVYIAKLVIEPKFGNNEILVQKMLFAK